MTRVESSNHIFGSRTSVVSGAYSINLKPTQRANLHSSRIAILIYGVTFKSTSSAEEDMKLVKPFLLVACANLRPHYALHHRHFLDTTAKRTRPRKSCVDILPLVFSHPFCFFDGLTDRRQSINLTNNVTFLQLDAGLDVVTQYQWHHS